MALQVFPPGTWVGAPIDSVPAAASSQDAPPARPTLASQASAALPGGLDLGTLALVALALWWVTRVSR